jgi:uncharacterized membrane protein YdbT with pleckstrin-like domain
MIGEMKYVTRVLQPGETVVYATTLHWLVYFRAVVLLLIGVGLLVAAAMVGDRGVTISGNPEYTKYLVTALQILAALFVVFAILSALRALIRRTTTELAITDRRVIYKAGLLRRHTIEINRSKVETVGVNQSILGRVMGFGTVVVRGTGGSFEPIPFIAEPLTFRNHITAG